MCINMAQMASQLWRQWLYQCKAAAHTTKQWLTTTSCSQVHNRDSTLHSQQPSAGAPVVHGGGVDFRHGRQVQDDPGHVLARLVRPLLRQRLILLQRLPHRLRQKTYATRQQLRLCPACHMASSKSDILQQSKLRLHSLAWCTLGGLRKDWYYVMRKLHTGTLA